MADPVKLLTQDIPYCCHIRRLHIENACRFLIMVLLYPSWYLAKRFYFEPVSLMEL